MATTVAAVLVLVIGGSALGDPTYPSQDDIDRAQQQVDLAQASVEQIEGELLRLADESEAAQIVAAEAGEDYNDAVVALQAAQDEVTSANQQVADTQSELDAANADLARIAQRAYLSGGELSGIEPLLSADGLDEALARAEAITRMGTATDRAVARVEVAKQAAQVAESRAKQALETQQQATEAADQAKRDADAAFATAAAQVQAASERRDEAFAVLAQRRNTTADLERQRQQGIEDERRRQAEEAARKAREDAERRAREDEEARRRASQTPAPTPAPTTRPVNPPAPPAPTPPAPVNPDPPSSASAGENAVAWARGQLGKPYVYGTAGPNTFDCSGLTSQAWLNGGGKWITRTSRSQYQAVTKVSLDSLRPGDLIFYANNTSNPSSIYHVAIYSGNGKMIHAPNPSKPVEEVTLRLAGSMPYAGRP